MLRHVPRAFLPLLAFTLLCGFQCDTEVPIGQTDGSTPDGGAPICLDKSPAGCRLDSQCSGVDVCTPAGLPSSCRCNAAGGWDCSTDALGGTCGPPASLCTEPDPSGCTMDSECDAELRCATGTRPSQCECDPSTDTWGCTRDLGGGDCVPDSCPDSGDDGVTYLGTSEAMCATIDFMCDEGQVALPSECGCGCRPAPEPDCGMLFCDYETQYCENVIPGVMGAEPTFECKTLPDTCGPIPTCATCFPEDSAGFCSEPPEGLRFTMGLP